MAWLERVARALYMACLGGRYDMPNAHLLAAIFFAADDARKFMTSPQRSEATGNRVVLIGRDTRLAADDEVSLAYRPLVPAIGSDLQTVSERTRAWHYGWRWAATGGATCRVRT